MSEQQTENPIPAKPTLTSTFARVTLTQLTLPVSAGFPYGTILVNIVGSFIIGFFGTLTLAGGRFPASSNLRLFVMVGLCGGFTTFSSFSLQTFDLLRSGSWLKALANVLLSVTLCLAAVAAGHLLAQQATPGVAIAESSQEENTG